LLGNDREIRNYTTAVTRQQRVKNKREMVFSAQSVPMAGHATVEYVMTSLSNYCIATENGVFYAVSGEML
jgi:hypothetical protein